MPLVSHLPTHRIGWTYTGTHGPGVHLPVFFFPAIDHNKHENSNFFALPQSPRHPPIPPLAPPAPETSFRGQKSGHREGEEVHLLVTDWALPYNLISIGDTTVSSRIHLECFPPCNMLPRRTHASRDQKMSAMKLSVLTFPWLMPCSHLVSEKRSRNCRA